MAGSGVAKGLHWVNKDNEVVRTTGIPKERAQVPRAQGCAGAGLPRVCTADKKDIH